jgi:hypothetical protein
MHLLPPLDRPFAAIMVLLTERVDRGARRFDTDRRVEDRQPDAGFPVGG